MVIKTNFTSSWEVQHCEVERFLLFYCLRSYISGVYNKKYKVYYAASPMWTVFFMDLIIISFLMQTPLPLHNN
jgi:hypothetical protein